MDLGILFWTIAAFIFGFIEDVSAASCPYFSPTGQYVYMACPSGCCGTTSYRYCCGSNRIGLIVGCTVGGIVLVGTIVGIILCCYFGVCTCATLAARSSSSSSASAYRNYKSTASLP